MNNEFLRALNSATKYPSILTYHSLGQKGRLTDEAPMRFEGPVVMTEKIDGTNGRIVKNPDGDWFIGSRENFLTAKGDRVYTPTENIVDVIAGLAEQMISPTDGWLAYYIEVYGGNIGGAAKQYTTSKGSFSYRMFDIVHVPDDVLKWPVENIALWREGGAQDFLPEEELTMHSNISNVPLTPRLGLMQGHQLPQTLEETQKWLNEFSPTTQAAVDHSGNNKSEGIVVRTLDRKTIAKVRHVNYTNTLGN